jgi:hypothetical protein
MRGSVAWAPRRSILAAFALCLLAAGAGSPVFGRAAATPADVASLVDGLGRAGLSAGGEAAAHRLFSTVSPSDLERCLEDRPDLAVAALPVLGRSLAEAGEPFARELAAYLAAVARERAKRLTRSGNPADPATATAGVEALTALMVVDPVRWSDDESFRRRLLDKLPSVFGPGSPVPLRDAALTALGGLPGLGFSDAEKLALAWGVAHRASTGRRFGAPAGAPPVRFSSDDDPIEASVYSLPSSYFTAEAAARLLAGVHAVAPRRRLVVLADLAQRLALAPLLGRWQPARSGAGADRAVELLDTWGRPFSPWPRDPMSLALDASGALVVVMRPNVQTGRAADADLGLALLDMLPDALDRAWGRGVAGVRWMLAPVPFHNGQVLMTQQAAWISLHTLEPRILALLGLDRVPVESFATADGIALYVGAARRAAAELAALYRRPVRFVHPLPDLQPHLPGGEPAAAADGAAGADGAARRVAVATDLMRRLGGGAGYDLDSLLTLLPAAPHGPVALVASVAAGRRLLAAAGPADWEALRAGYGLATPAGGLPAALAAAAEGPRPGALDSYLDLVAAHLEAEGFAVRRLPLVVVPTELLAGRHLGFPEFLITWNNVVVERLAGGERAEGFASLLPSGDALAHSVFAAAGCRLDLLPPLVESVLFNGGYRCASNQLRRAAAGGPPPAAR